MTDRDRAEAALSKLAVATREKMDPVLLQVYLDDPRVKFYSIKDIEAACHALMGTATWFPKLAEFLEALRAQARKRIEAMPKLGPPELPPTTKEEATRILEKLYAATGRKRPQVRGMK